MNSKLRRSNDAHMRLFEKNLKINTKADTSSKDRFYSAFKKNYHLKVYDEQLENNSVLSKEKKRGIYMNEYLNTVRDFQAYMINHPGKKVYLPKKFR